MGAHVSIPMYQRTLAQRYLLVGLGCPRCGALSFPPKGVCTNCLNREGLAPVRMSGKGELYAFTVIAGGGAPPEFHTQAVAKGSYVVGLVQLDEGPRIMAQLVGAELEQVHVGMRVEAVLRRIYEEEGIVRYGLKFKPS